jgi:hypothetical protein
MYFPYLRGKQFELIALRELSQFVRVENLISPIIEPVKETTVTLNKTLESLRKNNFNFNLVLNPQVGDMQNIDDALKLIIILEDYPNYQPSFIVDEKTNLTLLAKIIASNHLENLSLICNAVPNDEEILMHFIEANPVKYLIINEGINSKRFLRNLKRFPIEKVTLSDAFNVMKRNVDYIQKPNEFYSDEHLFYIEDGFIGFSDFLTIGQEYVDGGFLPYAVAIHLTYPNDNSEFWIRHFVSDSNMDSTDIANKFGEALSKLVAFIDDKNLHTTACGEFRQLLETQSYPGLGSVKKLSILHHIELVYDYLNTLQ